MIFLTAFTEQEQLEPRLSLLPVCRRNISRNRLIDLCDPAQGIVQARRFFQFIEVWKLPNRRILAASVCSLGGLIFGYDLGGGLTVGCPLYLAEIAPRVSRGRFVGMFQVQVGIGRLQSHRRANVCSPVSIGVRFCLQPGLLSSTSFPASIFFSFK
jgi:hypothetical protein